MCTSLGYRVIADTMLAWQTTYIDLLIHAPPKSSGSLIRLLKSIEEADYFGYRRPHITIELPADIDASTYNFLENMVWPPLDWSGAPHASQITLRHRIPKRSFTAAEASSYLVESFYPARPLDSHVLVLSPQVELSPLYYHYLLYSLLEHRYSKASDIDYLMGISLELPTNYLNGSAHFTPPTPKSRTNSPTPFLWEAPNCNAALYFGERWMEFHSFLGNRVSTMKSSTPEYKKQITESYPAWMEYLLELMRTRGYAMFYPNYESTTSSAFATAHSELYQTPEEYAKKTIKDQKDESPPALDPTDSLEADASTHARTKPHRPEPPLLTSSLLSLIPRDSPSLSTLPHISYDAQLLTASDRSSFAADYAATFRREIGNCAAGGGKKAHPPAFVERSADDLFCNLDDPPEDPPGQTNIDPLSTAWQEFTAPDADVYDPDAIPADSSAQIRDEFAAHLNRQSGQKEASTKGTSSGVLASFGDDGITVSSEEYDPKVEEDKEDIIPTDKRSKAKSEFQDYLARQSEQEKASADPQAQSLIAKPKSEKQTAEKPAVDKKDTATGDGKVKEGTTTETVSGTGAEQRDPGW